MTKEQFLLLYKAFVLLGRTESHAMADGTCEVVRKAESMIWRVLCGCEDEKSIVEYASEIEVTEDDIDFARSELPQ